MRITDLFLQIDIDGEVFICPAMPGPLRDYLITQLQEYLGCLDEEQMAWLRDHLKKSQGFVQ